MSNEEIFLTYITQEIYFVLNRNTYWIAIVELTIFFHVDCVLKCAQVLPTTKKINKSCVLGFPFIGDFCKN